MALAIAIVFPLPKANTLTDTNSNGMSDFWEKEYNSGSLMPSAFLPQDDTDGDGISNI